MPDLRPLAVYPYPLPERVAQAVRAVKVAMGFEFQATIVKALPGGPTRVLAFNKPDFLCDSVLVANASQMPSALAWVFGRQERHPDESLIVDKLRAIAGDGVREVFE